MGERPWILSLITALPGAQTSVCSGNALRVSMGLAVPRLTLGVARRALQPLHSYGRAR